jgi:hypothetical protein
MVGDDIYQHDPIKKYRTTTKKTPNQIINYILMPTENKNYKLTPNLILH